MEEEDYGFYGPLMVRSASTFFISRANCEEASYLDSRCRKMLFFYLEGKVLRFWRGREGHRLFLVVRDAKGKDVDVGNESFI